MTTEGFLVLQGANETGRVHWSELHEIVAYRLDLGTTDMICLGFRESDENLYKEVSEEWAGYAELRIEVQNRYAIDPGWWHDVAFPAFATNWTTLWRRGGPDE